MKTFFKTLFILFVFSLSAQNKMPYSFHSQLNEFIPEVKMPNYDFTKDIADAIAFEEAGNYPIFAHHFELDLSLDNSGVWTILENGDRIWRVHLKSNNALSTAIFFENFYLPKGSSLHSYSNNYSTVYSYDSENNQGNFLFSTDFMKTDEQTLEYYEPASVKGEGKITITAFAHQFRSIKMAGNCHVNIVCMPEGTNWQNEKKGVCRIYVVAGQGGGYCTGTLMNNTALDCKRYILTASHCGMYSSAANFNQYVFRFNYEANSCFGADNEGTTTNQFTGCVKRSDSNDNGGATGSDFLLLEMTSTSSPSWWATTAYYNGWTKASTSSSGGGVSIHHPLGANKKISTYSATPGSVSWGGSVANTHWEIKWIQTNNNWGVTEGGSSGAAVFNNAGLVFGTLTGGNSDCNNKTLGDAYGKMSYHWTSNGTATDRQLKPWLDPNNSGVTTLSGVLNPCASVGINTINSITDFSIYPNPSNGLFSIKFNNNSIKKIRIINIVGQEIEKIIFESPQNDDYSVDLSNQPNGIYFIEIFDNEKLFTKKISVVK